MKEIESGAKSWEELKSMSKVVLVGSLLRFSAPFIARGTKKTRP